MTDSRVGDLVSCVVDQSVWYCSVGYKLPPHLPIKGLIYTVASIGDYNGIVCFGDIILCVPRRKG